MDAVDIYADSDVADICIADVENTVEDTLDVNDSGDFELLCGVCEESCEDIMTNAPEVSVVNSPLFADDDRRELPALYHQDLQGGNSKSKHFVEDGIV